jgi:DDE family transposase
VVLADGGDCLSDLAALRDQPELFGPVASTPTAWRVLERTASDPDGLARLRAARAHARGRAWAAGGDPDVELLVVGADATLVLANSDHKEGAAGTYKHTLGFAPLLAYLDRGQAPGEPLAGLLRPGNAPPGASDDLVELVELALAQLPTATDQRPVLVRSDSAGGSSKLAWHLRQRGSGFTLGMQVDQHVREAILAQPEPSWTPAVDADGQARPGAEVCELTGWVDLGNWPDGTRAICRREDAHPGAQLRFTDLDGHRFQVFLTDQPDPTSPRLSCGTASAPGSRTASAPPRRPAFRTCHSTAGVATPSGSSWSWPPKTSPAGPKPAAGRCAGGRRAQDPALPAAPRRRPGRAPRPPVHPAAASLLAVGGRARPRVRPAPGPAAALLTRPAAPTTHSTQAWGHPGMPASRAPPLRPGVAAPTGRPVGQRSRQKAAHTPNRRHHRHRAPS